jgi:hypothetical protein
MPLDQSTANTQVREEASTSGQLFSMSNCEPFEKKVAFLRLSVFDCLTTQHPVKANQP